jgi:hypothetical protein
MTATLHLKSNSCGSWANVITFPADKTDQVKDACETLLQAAAGRVSFKITDEKNVTQSALDARFEPVGWSDR